MTNAIQKESLLAKGQVQNEIASSGRAKISNAERITLKKAAQAFEALFVKELLKNGHNDSKGLFGGGMGESFFQDHLDDERANLMASSGKGIGLGLLVEKEVLRSYGEDDRSNALLKASTQKKESEKAKEFQSTTEKVNRTAALLAAKMRTEKR